MKINHVLVNFPESFRWQHLQDKNNLNAFEMFREKLMAIRTAGDHLAHAATLEAFVNFLQSSQGCWRVTQLKHRIIAAIQDQSDFLLQMTTQDILYFADQSRQVRGQTASRPEDCVCGSVKRKRKSMTGFGKRQGTFQSLTESGRNLILPGQSFFCFPEGRGR